MIQRLDPRTDHGQLLHASLRTHRHDRRRSAHGPPAGPPLRPRVRGRRARVAGGCGHGSAAARRSGGSARDAPGRARRCRRPRSPITCSPRGRSSRSGRSCAARTRGRRHGHTGPAAAAHSGWRGPLRGDEGRRCSPSPGPGGRCAQRRRGQRLDRRRSSHALRRRPCVAAGGCRPDPRSLDAREQRRLRLRHGPRRDHHAPGPARDLPDLLRGLGVRSCPRSRCVSRSRAPPRRTTHGIPPRTSPCSRTRARSSPG